MSGQWTRCQTNSASSLPGGVARARLASASPPAHVQGSGEEVGSQQALRAAASPGTRRSAPQDCALMSVRPAGGDVGCRVRAEQQVRELQRAIAETQCLSCSPDGLFAHGHHLAQVTESELGSRSRACGRLPFPRTLSRRAAGEGQGMPEQQGWGAEAPLRPRGTVAPCVCSVQRDDRMHAAGLLLTSGRGLFLFLSFRVSLTSFASFTLQLFRGKVSCLVCVHLDAVTLYAHTD